MFGLFRYFRRKRLRSEPFPDHWPAILDEFAPFHARLQGAERERFHELLKIFAREKHFMGAGGFEMTEEAIVVISAAAVRLVLHLDLDYYDRLTEILVYPSHYKHPDNDDGVIFGEAHQWGTVVLSWSAVVSGLKNPRDGHDTATHEFAHVLDREGGEFNGTPALRASHDYDVWANVMSRHYFALRDQDSDERAVLRMYGATNEAEFFAVATESFFEKPEQMKKHTPALYDELSRFYGFDPVPDED